MTSNSATSKRQETYVHPSDGLQIRVSACLHVSLSPPELTTLASLLPSQHFLALISTSPDLSSPYLYLAQLSNTPQESLSHFENAVRILEVQLNELVAGKETPEGDEDERIVEKELRRQISGALVGMTEVYLTDLWSVRSRIRH